jgi:uncharacterized protein
MAANETISVEVIYIEPDSQNSLTIDVTQGTTIEQAIRQSGLLEQFPQIDLSINKVGIYSKVQPLDTILQSGDRVEIYRPLLADPKEARRERAKKK